MASVPVIIPLEIQQGDTWVKSFVWTRGGVPVDFTDATARMQIRASFGTASALLELSTENDGIQLLADGRIALTITATQSAALPAMKSAVYDLEVYFPGGIVVKPFKGNAAIAPEVTK